MVLPTSRRNIATSARHIAPAMVHFAIWVHHMFPMSTPKNPGKAIAISQPQETYARREGFMSRLLESNEVLAAALVRLRDFYLAGAPPLVTDKVLAQVETALEMARRVENGF
jgi:hypothetical protein